MISSRFRKFTSDNRDRSGWGGFRPGDRVDVVVDGKTYAGMVVQHLDPDGVHVMAKAPKSAPWRLHVSFLKMVEEIK